MLARFLLISLLLLPAAEESTLARSGISDRDLTKVCKDVQAFFDALDEDDRGKQQESLDKIEDALEKAAKKEKLEGSLLRYLGDWDVILEQAKPEDRSIKGNIGKGFWRHTFGDPWDPEGRKVVCMVSVPQSYASGELLPAIIALKGELGADAGSLEKAAPELASSLYADLLQTHIVLVPLGVETGGRKAELAATEGSWFLEQNRYVFFTALRVLLEQLRFDRSRILLDGWGGEAGLDAMRLATFSPSFFAGVINRSGAVQDEQAILENLRGVSVLYVKGATDGGPEDISVLTDGEGIEVRVLEDPGSALAPSEETRTATLEWMGAQRRDLAPTEVHLKVRDLTSGSIAWCTAGRINRRVTASPGDADFPRLHARVDRSNNTIELETVNVLEVWLHLSDAVVDLDKPVTVRVNGEDKLRNKTFRRSLRNMLEGRFFNNSGDYGLYTAKALIEDIEPNVPKKDS